MAIERFIALAIISVSRVPLAPTSMPATISTVESSTKPVAEAARPVNALSSEITTGMSAPPIGRTNMTPNSSARQMSATIAHSPSTPATIATPSAAAPPSTRMLKTFWPGNTIGRPLTSSCSFAKATSEPANEIDPISADSTVESASSQTRTPELSWNSDSATSAAAPPPTPLNRATICGIAVIFTVRAPTSPTTAPISPPMAISAQLPIPSSSNVVAIATIIPTPPIQFPLRACLGDERKRSARTKQMIETR